MSGRQLAALATVVAVLVAVPASAASSVSVNAARDGDTAVVSGTVVAVDSPVARMGEDPAGDGVDAAGAAAGGVAGADLRAFDIQSMANGDIEFRWVVESMPVPTGAPGPIYGFSWAVNGQGYELDVARVTRSESKPAEPAAVLWVCDGAYCNPDTQTRSPHEDSISVTFDTANRTVTARLGASVIGLTPGAVMEQTFVGQVPGTVYTGAGLISSPYTYSGFDMMMLNDNYVVPRLAVSLGAAAPGTDPSAVAYTSPAAVDGTGFTGRVPAASGDAVFARACTVSGREQALDQVCATGAGAALP